MQAPINNLPARKNSSLTSAALLLGVAVEVLEELLPELQYKNYERQKEIKNQIAINPESV